MDIVDVFRRSARRHADRTFLFDVATSVTYAEADRRSDAIAAYLIALDISAGATLGLAASDRVALWLAVIGAWKAGALPGLIDVRTGPEDLPYFVKDIGARVVAAAPEFRDRLQAAEVDRIVDLAELGNGAGGRVAEHGPDAPLYLSYTSGTTGAPKGVVLLSGPVTLGTACIAERLELRREDVLLATTPTASSFQLVAAIMPAIHVGAAVGLVSGSSIEDMWGTARRSGATVLVAYPLTLADMVNHPEAEKGDHPFRLALSGGSPLAPRIKRDYRDRLGIHLLESYGQSELGGFMALGSVADGDRALEGFVGRPLPDRWVYVGADEQTELPPGEVGEVLVTEGFFAEYRNNPEHTAATKAGGVLHTGDVGLSDENGYLKVMGRTREVERATQRGGYLRELEDAYYEHPDVLHATVVEGGDGTVEAFVELLPGREASPDALQKPVAEQVASGLAPVKTTIMGAMPRTFSGKADRLRLSSGVGS